MSPATCASVSTQVRAVFRLSVCMPACLAGCHCLCVCVCLLVCHLYVCLSGLPLDLSVCLLVCLSACWLFVHLSVCLRAYRPVVSVYVCSWVFYRPTRLFLSLLFCSVCPSVRSLVRPFISCVRVRAYIQDFVCLFCFIVVVVVSSFFLFLSGICFFSLSFLLSSFIHLFTRCIQSASQPIRESLSQLRVVS